MEEALVTSREVSETCTVYHYCMGRSHGDSIIPMEYSHQFQLDDSVWLFILPENIGGESTLDLKCIYSLLIVSFIWPSTMYEGNPLHYTKWDI